MQKSALADPPLPVAKHECKEGRGSNEKLYEVLIHYQNFPVTACTHSGSGASDAQPVTATQSAHHNNKSRMNHPRLVR